MLIAIIGENCVGKTTLANRIKERTGAAIYAGNDYLRLEKNPSSALETFKKMLQNACTAETIIYIITEKEHLQLLPDDAFRIVVTEELDVIKARFQERMKGTLPLPLEKKLERNHGMYDDLTCNLKLTHGYDLNDVLSALNLPPQ